MNIIDILLRNLLNGKSLIDNIKKKLSKCITLSANLEKQFLETTQRIFNNQKLFAKGELSGDFPEHKKNVLDSYRKKLQEINKAGELSDMDNRKKEPSAPKKSTNVSHDKKSEASNASAENSAASLTEIQTQIGLTEEELTHLSNLLQKIAQSTSGDFSAAMREIAEGIQLSGSALESINQSLGNYLNLAQKASAAQGTALDNSLNFSGSMDTLTQVFGLLGQAGEVGDVFRDFSKNLDCPAQRVRRYLKTARVFKMV